MVQPSSDDDARGEPCRIETTLDEQVSAAPEPLRSCIQELERQAAPASNLRELVCGREERKMLGLAILELEQAIRKHHDAQGGDRCEPNDLELYEAVDLSGGPVSQVTSVGTPDLVRTGPTLSKPGAVLVKPAF